MLIGVRVHLFPYRTQKLSSRSPKILAGRLAGKIGNADIKSSSQTRAAFIFTENQRRPKASAGCVLISVRVFALPVPAVAAHVCDGLLCFPAEHGFCLGGVGIDGRQIACAARANNVGDGDVVDLGEGVDHLQDTHAAAGAEIEDLAAGVLLKKAVLSELQC